MGVRVYKTRRNQCATCIQYIAVTCKCLNLFRRAHSNNAPIRNSNRFNKWSQAIPSPHGRVHNGEINTGWSAWSRHRTTRDEQESTPKAMIAVALHSMLALEQETQFAVAEEST